MTEPCSLLFVPADTDRFLAKAGQRGADVLILDLEDAVAFSAKAAARANLAAFVPRLQAEAGVPIYVRVNNEPDLLAADLAAAIGAGADGLLCPKVETPEQVVRLDADMRVGLPALFTTACGTSFFAVSNFFSSRVMFST